MPVSRVNTMPLPGLPITVTRTYDSRAKRVGDFGVGWTVTLSNVRVQKNGPIGQFWDEEVSWSGSSDQYCLEPVKNHTVTLTFGDGRVYRFHAISNPECQLFVQQPSFQPVTRNVARLFHERRQAGCDVFPKIATLDIEL